MTYLQTWRRLTVCLSFQTDKCRGRTRWSSSPALHSHWLHPLKMNMHSCRRVWRRRKWSSPLTTTVLPLCPHSHPIPTCLLPSDSCERCSEIMHGVFGTVDLSLALDSCAHSSTLAFLSRGCTSGESQGVDSSVGAAVSPGLARVWSSHGEPASPTLIHHICLPLPPPKIYLFFPILVLILGRADQTMPSGAQSHQASKPWWKCFQMWLCTAFLMAKEAIIVILYFGPLATWNSIIMINNSDQLYNPLSSPHGGPSQ